MELNPNQYQSEPTQEKVAMYEPNILPVEEKGQVFLSSEQEYIPKQVGLVEKFSQRYIDRISNYRLIIHIGDFDYLFKIFGKERQNNYGVSFKTLQYEYATTSLNEKETELLFESFADILETAYKDSEEKITSFDISPADAPYSHTEIEGCISEILKSPKKDFSEEVLRENYKGYKIFDLYQEIFDKPYGDDTYGSVSKARARSRYFKMQFRKYLKYWDVSDMHGVGISFTLKRKG